MKTVIIFHRLGPYHRARVLAVKQLTSLVVIETSGADATYAWDFVSEADGIERVTLFENADAQKMPTPAVAQRLESVLDNICPEIVVIPGWSDAAALAALYWCQKKQVATIIMSESTAWDEKRSLVKEWVKHQVVGLGSAALVGGTPHRDYLAKLGMPPDNIFLGYDAVDNSYFAKKAALVRNQKSEVRKKRGLPEKYFLASARFVEKKNLPRLIEAYAVYRKSAEVEYAKTEIWDLVLLGDGALREDLEARSLQLGVSQWIHLSGFRQYPDLPDYYGCAQVFIHASTTEQWGLVVNEAMATGLPVLVSHRCGCATDLVRNGINGFTFDPFSAEKIAEVMLKVSEPGFPLIAFGEASQRIIADWGPKRFADGLLAATETALEVGTRRASIIQQLILKALLRK